MRTRLCSLWHQQAWWRGPFARFSSGTRAPGGTVGRESGTAR
ncbi:hypothetical protein ACFZAE_09490 [Streptomyces scabiei]